MACSALQTQGWLLHIAPHNELIDISFECEQFDGLTETVPYFKQFILPSCIKERGILCEIIACIPLEGANEIRKTRGLTLTNHPALPPQQSDVI